MTTFEAPVRGEDVVISYLTHPETTFKITEIISFHVEHKVWFVELNNRDNVPKTKAWVKLKRNLVQSRPRWEIYDIDTPFLIESI